MSSNVNDRNLHQKRQVVIWKRYDPTAHPDLHALCFACIEGRRKVSIISALAMVTGTSSAICSHNRKECMLTVGSLLIEQANNNDKIYFLWDLWPVRK